MGCGGIGFVCVVMRLLIGGRLGLLATFVTVFHVLGSLIVLCVVLV
jgi:hypothetical protein